MKNILIFIIVGLMTLSACKKECPEKAMSVESCDTNTLVLLDSTAPSLRKYVIRYDTSALYGYATAIKSVPGKGEVRWVANNKIENVNNQYYLFMPNYGDTTWRHLEYWAYLREDIGIKFNPFILGRQQVRNEQAYLADSTLNYSAYYKHHDDFTEAYWKISGRGENYISVNRINHENKIIEGEFDLNFILTNQNSVYGPYSDEIRFRWGKFKAKIFE